MLGSVVESPLKVLLAFPGIIVIDAPERTDVIIISINAITIKGLDPV